MTELKASSSPKDNAISLYMEGIQNGRPREAVMAFTGDRYTQHSTGVADGQEGFIAFFEPFIERNPVREFRVVRALQDGPNVFVQVYQNINDGEAEWLTTDFFDSDAQGRIVEHWDVISAFEGPNAAGHTQIDGPAEPQDLEKTADNKALVSEFVSTCLMGGDMARIADFVASDLVEHDPDGRGLLAGNLAYQDCVLTVAEGNFVATLNRASEGDQDICQVDLYRVADGKIVDHWGNTEPVPPKDEWANSGKF